MKTIVYKSKAIQAVILIAAACILLTLWPFRLWKEIVPASIPQQTGEVIGPIDDDRMLVQSFVAQYDHMDSIRIFLGEDSMGESFYFRMLNPESQMMFEEKVEIDPSRLPGFYDVLVDIDLNVGEMYFCIVQGDASAVFVGCEYISMTDMPYAGTMYYMESSLEGLNLVADYNYIVPLRKQKVLLYGGLITVIAVFGVLATGLYYKKNRYKEKLITVERVFKHIMNPIVSVLIFAGLTAASFQVFGTYMLDNLFFFISILLLAVVLFYGINHNRDGQAPLVNKEIIRDKWSHWLQSVFIAGAIGACCEYMSGLFDIHHTIAERKEMIFFALMIIVMFGANKIFKLYNLIYLIAAGVCGYYYYNRHFSEELQELDVQALNLITWVGILTGFVILNVIIHLIKRIIKREMNHPAYVYSGLIAFFFLLLIIFRNTRWWPVALVVAFTLFYIQYGDWSKKERLLNNICRGIALHFIWSTGYALLHRPFVTFRTARYTHIFHTVTITATYLTIVECAALVIFLVKFRKSHKLKDIWKEALFFGVVTSYLLFTMARTGFFAAAVMAVFAVLIMTCGKGLLNKIKNMAVAVVMLILAVIICFPITFTVQRTIPALVSDPYLYDIESYPDDILRGRKVNSVEFMRVGRFIDVFADKIFNVPEGTFDIYGEIAAYRKEHGITASGREDSKKVNSKTGFIKTGFLRTDNEWQSGVHVVTQDLLVASADYTPDGDGGEPETDYTNGRIDIFKSYLEQLNMTGHPDMGALLQDGSIATHAHNIYLQVAYDHGIPMGILFIIIGGATFIKACIYYYRNKEREEYAALPAVVTVTVAVAGMVEWIFHLSNPSGFVLMLVIAPLIFSRRKEKEKAVLHSQASV